MKLNSLKLTLASVAVGSVITFGSATASAFEDHLEAAFDFILNAGVNDTDIASDGCYIDWTVSPYVGHTVGACYFVELLKGGYDYSSLDTKAMWNKNSPTSHDYFTFIKNSPEISETPPSTETYFRRITKITQVDPGDVIAIGASGSYSGHTMVVIGDPILLSPQLNPKYSGTSQWAVPITDSTNSNHGCNAAWPDSRQIGDCTSGSFVPGAGTAYIRIYTDLLTGNLLGYTWSVTSGSTYYSPSTRPYRIGRLVNLPAPLPTDPPPPPPVAPEQ